MFDRLKRGLLLALAMPPRAAAGTRPNQSRLGFRNTSNDDSWAIPPPQQQQRNGA